mmetsp:Transcript_38174/g.94860  ORF Transcript_38174/g.94860 Transcript_38174/m.94860 type:complete len:228 (-) Transcript_38174:1525-2208(-)
MMRSASVGSISSGSTSSLVGKAGLSAFTPPPVLASCTKSPVNRSAWLADLILLRMVVTLIWVARSSPSTSSSAAFAADAAVCARQVAAARATISPSRSRADQNFCRSASKAAARFFSATRCRNSATLLVVARRSAATCSTCLSCCRQKRPPHCTSHLHTPFLRALSRSNSAAATATGNSSSPPVSPASDSAKTVRASALTPLAPTRLATCAPSAPSAAAHTDISPAV